MRMPCALGALALAFPTIPAAALDHEGCHEEALEIREKEPDGITVRLEFGSLWAIERIDRVHTRVWLRLERVHICRDGLQHEDPSYIVRAFRLQ